MQLSKKDKALLIEGLGLKLMNLKTSIEALQEDGMHGLAADLYPKCDEVIDLQNRVRDAA